MQTHSQTIKETELQSIFFNVFGIIIRIWQSRIQTFDVLKSVNLIISKILCIYLHAYKYTNGLTKDYDINWQLIYLCKHLIFWMGSSLCLTWLWMATVSSLGGRKKKIICLSWTEMEKLCGPFLSLHVLWITEHSIPQGHSEGQPNIPFLRNKIYSFDNDLKRGTRNLVCLQLENI